MSRVRLAFRGGLVCLEFALEVARAARAAATTFLGHCAVLGGIVAGSNDKYETTVSFLMDVEIRSLGWTSFILSRP